MTPVVIFSWDIFASLRLCLEKGESHFCFTLEKGQSHFHFTLEKASLTFVLNWETSNSSSCVHCLVSGLHSAIASFVLWLVTPLFSCT